MSSFIVSVEDLDSIMSVLFPIRDQLKMITLGKDNILFSLPHNMTDCSWYSLSKKEHVFCLNSCKMYDVRNSIVDIESILITDNPQDIRNYLIDLG